MIIYQTCALTQNTLHAFLTAIKQKKHRGWSPEIPYQWQSCVCYPHPLKTKFIVSWDKTQLSNKNEFSHHINYWKVFGPALLFLLLLTNTQHWIIHGNWWSLCEEFVYFSCVPLWLCVYNRYYGSLPQTCRIRLTWCSWLVVFIFITVQDWWTVQVHVTYSHRWSLGKDFIQRISGKYYSLRF